MTVITASMANLVSANYSFTAWRVYSCENKITSTSGNSFDGFCHDVRGQDWHGIGGSAMSVKGERVEFYASGDCTGNGFYIDDTAGCEWLSPPNFRGEIGSWRAVKV